MTKRSRNGFGTAVTFSTVLVAVTMGGCTEHAVKATELKHGLEGGGVVELQPNNKVDLLLVVDNSGSMAEEQANLARNFGPLIRRLEEFGADYRIGITTTDAGNPACAGTTPERGKLVSSSCLGRLTHFSSSASPESKEEACTDFCNLGGDVLELTETTTFSDATPKARPWIQAYNGVTNLPEGVSPEEAFQCIAPQGIDGCGHESPLEAMRLALLRMVDDGEASNGFLRSDAILSVLIVTDEADCSVNPGQEDIFGSNQVFWSALDIENNTPQSGVCWRAGVECIGSGGSGYESCEAVDRDATGAITDDPSKAVLRPVSEYIDFLQSVVDNKGQYFETAAAGEGVMISLISGVPDHYENPSDIEYADSPDPQFQADFGIGPGCSSSADGETQNAVPPVRLRDFAEHFQGEDPNLYSVCSQDYSPALDAIGEALIKQFKPACFPKCLEDVDPSQAGLQVACEVSEISSSEEKRPMSICDGGPGAWELPEGEDACYGLRLEDDRVPECQANDGQNAQFEIVRREGVEVPPGMRVEANCEVATHIDVTCG